MKRTILLPMLLIMVSILWLTNCEDILDDREVSYEDSLAATVLVTDANAIFLPLIEGLFAADLDSAQSILNSLDLGGPHAFYAEAYEKDWRNQEATFGLGFSGFLILSQNTVLDNIFGSSVKVHTPFAEAGETAQSVGYGFGLPLSIESTRGMIATYFETPLSLARLQFESLETFNDFQTQVQYDLIPMADASLAALDSLDVDPAFVFNLGMGIQLDITDITAMESSLLGLQGFFKSLTAYNYTVDTSDSSTIVAGLSSGSSFGTLNAGGATLLSEAHASALSAIGKAEEVLEMVNAESPEETHFLVHFSQSETSQIQTALDDLNSALAGPTTVAFSYEAERGLARVEGSASMDISQYYLNPVADSKALLPPYTVSATSAYSYNQVTLNEQVSFDEAEVLIEVVPNTPISIYISYSESNSDTTALVTMGLLTYNLLVANTSALPAAVLELWNEFLLTIGDYSDDLYQYPEISFQWSGVITTGTMLNIDGNIAVDYLERTGSYTAPVILWTATSYGDWVTGWSNPTVNGLFPNYSPEDLALLLGLSWE